MGDLPVLLINSDGTGEAIVNTDRFRINDLFDADGSAIIIHGSPDNYANIPTRQGRRAGRDDPGDGRCRRADRLRCDPAIMTDRGGAAKSM